VSGRNGGTAYLALDSPHMRVPVKLQLHYRVRGILQCLKKYSSSFLSR
jgi:hypothetical protein